MPQSAKVEVEWGEESAELKAFGRGAGHIKLEYTKTTNRVRRSGDGSVERLRTEFAATLEMVMAWLYGLAKVYGQELGDPGVQHTAFYHEPASDELRIGSRANYIQIVFTPASRMVAVAVLGAPEAANIGSHIMAVGIAQSWEKRNFLPPPLAV